AQAPLLDLLDTDVVPGTTLTVNELSKIWDEYNYPPFRQEIAIREIKQKLANPADLRQKLAKVKLESETKLRALQQHLQQCETQSSTAPDSATLDYYQQLAQTDREQIAQLEHSLTEQVAQLEDECKSAELVFPKFEQREMYLVKWKGASYKSLTWEWAEAIDDDMKIALFRRIETPPSGVSVLNRTPAQLQAIRERRLLRKQKQQQLLLQNKLEVDPRQGEMDLLRFSRAAEILQILHVPCALLPYALQLEVSGLAAPDDEIICVNGIRCTGLRTEEVNKLIKERTMEHRVLRFLRRETGHELEIKFDPSKRMGFVMDELRQSQFSNTSSGMAPQHLQQLHSNFQQQQQHMSMANRMNTNKQRRTTVDYSARVKKFSTPDDFTRTAENPAPEDKTSPEVRSAVIAVFVARERLRPLTLQTFSNECNVPVEYIHAWLMKQVGRDEHLQRNEHTFQIWVARNAQAFGSLPTVDLATIETALLNTQQAITLPQASKTDVFTDPLRLFARNLLTSAKNELLGTENRFEAEARRQENDFVSLPSVSEEHRKHQDELLRQKQEEMEEDDEEYFAKQGGNTANGLYMQQLRRIQQLQSGGVPFIPYSAPGNLPRFKNTNTLREYQLQGVNWMIQKWYEAKNCILADEMGLGKTVQVVAFLEHLRARESLRGPYLIVAPLSTMGHWRREFENWTDANVCFYYDTVGGAAGRRLIRDHEWFYEKLNNRHDVCKFNILLTTYETYIADVDEMNKIPFLSLVIDEAHRLKNQKGKLLMELKKLRVKHRLLLSGTPLQNNLNELWSLLNFCEPDKFPSLDLFLKRNGTLQGKEDVLRLQQDIAPYMLRRVKEDVEKSIPPKEETIVDIELTILQKKYYRAIYDRNREFLYKGCRSNNKPQLINVEIELRKCCNHPFLINGAKDKEVEELTARLAMESAGTDQEDQAKRRNSLYLQRVIQSSGKLVVLDKLLVKLKSEGRKVLIFSQMVKMLDVLGEYLTLRGFAHERLDGSVQGNTRQAAIDRFSRPDSKSFVFLLSTRAGGVGINLTAADTCIIFDSDWNPQNDAQAQARCHRIGQLKPVTIYRFVTKNSYEEIMLDRAAKKLGLEQAVLGSATVGGTSGKDLSPEELEKMLRLGAYHHLKSNTAKDDEESLNFMNQDIDSLLRTRTRKIQVDGIRGSVSLELTHNTVNEDSKLTPTAANSVLSKEEEEKMKVDLNDPDFWKKMLPEADNEQTLLFQLNEQSGELKRDAELRFKFIKRVKELVEEILSMRDNGDVVDHNRMDTTVALLVTIGSLKTVFGKEACDSAIKWRLALEQSKERKSRVRARAQRGGGGGGDDEDFDAKPDEEEEDQDELEDEDDEEMEEDGFASTAAQVPSASFTGNYGFQACHKCNSTLGVDLMGCTGTCKRAFHPECYRAGSSNFEQCDECRTHKHKCLLCKQVITGEEEEAEKCSRQDCGKYYHMACLKDQQVVDKRLVNWNPPKKAEVFHCPSHRCAKCFKGDGPVAGKVELQCVNCFKAYHPKCMFAAERTKRVSKNLIVCEDHFPEGGKEYSRADHLKFGGELPKPPVAKKAPSSSSSKKRKSAAAAGGGGSESKRKRKPKRDGDDEEEEEEEEQDVVPVKRSSAKKKAKVAVEDEEIVDDDDEVDVDDDEPVVKSTRSGRATGRRSRV
ncbi:hypothetical protein BASA82_000099, partial [Batrachochytrium salamandrivorans]